MKGDRCPPELHQAYADGRVVPFVGAGASMAVRWSDERGNKKSGPSWQAIADQACYLMDIDPELLRVRGSDLQILEYMSLKKRGLGELKTWLVRELDAPDDSLRDSVIHKELASLEACSVCYTTNYDDYIEKALRLNGRGARAVACAADVGPRRADCTDVVKFHGDFNHMDRMVLTEKQYRGRLMLRDEMDVLFRADFLNGVALFIGYSFRDVNVAYLFETIKADFPAVSGPDSGTRGFILVGDPSDFERTLFRAKNFQIIAVDSAQMEGDTARVLREMRS